MDIRSEQHEVLLRHTTDEERMRELFEEYKHTKVGIGYPSFCPFLCRPNPESQPRVALDAAASPKCRRDTTIMNIITCDPCA